ncbi:hypothetical protein E1176_14735, partial [Fulvivirga sp. RKSG066]|uniref:hypothetical protein n=1 Tax=Fulvivirga aurantia TaxID=2529383 RepID=UPI001CA41BBC
MKKYIILIVFMIGSVGLRAQSCDQATFSTEPAAFTAEDEVKLSVDLSGCTYLSGLDEVYIWIFVPGGPGPDGVGGNGDFCNGSNSELLMNNEGEGVWSFTFTPTDLFDATPAEIGGQIGFIPKEFAACKGNGDQTVDLFLTVDPSEFIPTESRTFPAKFGQHDFVTLYFDQNLAQNEAMATLDEVYVYTWANGVDSTGMSIGDVAKAEWTEVGNTEELKMSDEGEGIFSLTFDLNT